LASPTLARPLAFRALADSVAERLGTLSALKLPTIG